MLEITRAGLLLPAYAGSSETSLIRCSLLVTGSSKDSLHFARTLAFRGVLVARIQSTKADPCFF